MTEKELSQLQQAYRSFFLERLRSFGVNSPAELSKEKKSIFFTGIKTEWPKVRAKREYIGVVTGNRPVPKTEIGTIPSADHKPKSGVKNTGRFQNPELHQQTREVIFSTPAPEQTADLRILFSPNSFFEQGPMYSYPVVKMPKANSYLKLPRAGRSNQKGYKENDFLSRLRFFMADQHFLDDVHMVIPHFNRPYEPDIVLYDKDLNLYIDIEVDEPYDGYYRYPTHNLRSEEEQKRDDIRDLFFTESGWIVIRFTEKQVHTVAEKCITHIKNVLASIYSDARRDESLDLRESQWDDNQAIQWQKNFYRERYLGISGFQKQGNIKEVLVDTQEKEPIEGSIQRTKKFDNSSWNASIAFDEETHKYLDPKDTTGNAEYISVTTLIERFFPFDLRRYIERKALEEQRPEEDILLEHLMIRDEAADKGTFLHEQIENFLTGRAFDAASAEFGYFTDFYENEVKKRNLEFSEAEKVIFSKRFNVAGTIDCLFRKPDKAEYVMLDWKRSKTLIIDGKPRIFGHGYASSELSHLDNSSYFRYCLQQNIYKYIAETEFSLRISSMKLVVLHENYKTYHLVNVPEMRTETLAILNSLNLKI